MTKISLLYLLTNFCFTGFNYAYGDIHDGIIKITEEIKNILTEFIYM
jgi:hypothetical protein